MPKVILFHQHGGPDNLQLTDVRSTQPGNGEVKLRIQAGGLNRSEVLYLRGFFEKSEPPSRIGLEASGVIQAVGPDVDRNLVGKHVSTQGGFDQCRYGVLGEEAIVPVSAIAEYPSCLSPIQAASIWIPYLTAWGALIHYARVAPGDFVVIPAASSSVGLAAMQIVKDAGAVAIAATRTSNKREELIRLGADHVVATEEEDLPARVERISSGKGSRIIFDPVGGQYVETLARAAASGATIFLYGGLSGQPTIYPLMTALAKGISLRGYSMNEVRSDPVVLQRARCYISERLEDARFTPTIAKTFPLEESAAAYRFLESNFQTGKIVITVAV